MPHMCSRGGARTRDQGLALTVLGSTVDTLMERGYTGSAIAESSLSKRKTPCPTT